MNKRVKVCLALFLALAVIAQYSFSPQVMIAYGEDGEVTAASEESSGDSGQTAEKKEAEKPAPAPEQKATEAPAPAPAASSDSSDSSDTPEPAESAAPAEENDSAEADETSAADDVDVGEEEPAVDEEEALEEEEEEGFPAQDFSGEANGVSVKVSAPKGALPEGTKMSVKGVSADQVQAAVEGLVDGEVANLKAVDISFKCDGKEIEPKKAVSVHMTASGVEADKVVHIADSGNANVVGASTSGNSASFKSADFSIYVVVEDGETGDDARLNVVFVKANGDEVKMPITKRQIADINTYIYDPGVGDISGKFFKGWAEENEDYTAETPSNTISDIRTTVTNKLNAGVEEGDTLYYYAMVFDSYKVTYRDQNGVTLKTDENLYRSDEEDHTYTISLTYEPYSEESEEEGSDTMASQFMGWEQISPAVSEETIYQPNDEITLTGDIILNAKVSKVYWLVFN
ncbi:MAG: hypothetical protein IJH05_04720 [Firmicutes bacterium]|nr:hypothetical protein [Bacillota bacterium]